MNNIEINKGKGQMKKISLTKEEKNKMLNNLSIYADLNMPILKPNIEKVLSFYGMQINTRMAYVLASVLFLILIGGGAVYASENSLPGDMLYPIKTKITEPIVKTLSITPEAKAKTETRLTEKRLKEAEALEKKGRLTPEKKELIKEKIDNHFVKYSEAKNKVLEKKEETIKKIEENFKNRIEKHSEIINKLGKIKNPKETAQNNEKYIPAEQTEAEINPPKPEIMKSIREEINRRAQFQHNN